MTDYYWSVVYLINNASPAKMGLYKDFTVEELLSEKEAKSGILIHVLAKGFWEGIIEIVKLEQDEHERAKSIQALIQYHMSGMACFL